MTAGSSSAGRSRSLAAAAAVLALLVVTAGCSGLPVGQQTATEGDPAGPNTQLDGTQSDTPTAASEATATETGSQSNGDTTTTGAPTGTAVTGGFGDYEFSEGERYVYSAALSGSDRRIDVSWEVLDVSGDQLTVEGNATLSMFQAATWEGTRDEVYQQLGSTDNFAGSLFLSLHAGNRVATGHSLAAGNTWTVTAEDFPSGFNVSFETAEAEVTGTDSYAGIECTNVRITPDTDDMERATYCVNPDYPFALALTSEENEATDIVLSEADR